MLADQDTVLTSTTEIFHHLRAKVWRTVSHFPCHTFTSGVLNC